MEDLFVVLLYVSLVCFIWSLFSPKSFYPLFKNKLQKKGTRVVFGIAMLLFLFILVAIMDTENENEKAKVEQKSTQEVVDEKTRIEVAENKQDVKDEPEKTISLNDKLWLALDNSMKKRDGYEISLDENKKDVQISFESKEFWDENSLVRGAYSLLVKYGKEAFKLEGVDLLTVKYKTEFTDGYGKKGIEDAIIITMSKEEFNKFEWENLKMLPVYKQIEGSALKYYIHPAVKNNLNYDKLYLSI